ncbi:uncharacterized protein LOC133914572 [Phragmites australis]|uniref:uncharacterized protein LOC133914572 n=1 Tax=Phragmites australis TaxID=29695 RepID=UPI002D76884F|nr:uncharacterized protein LOC133914572 [Phragmites australis]
MSWMIEGMKYEVKYLVFARMLGLEVRDTSKAKIHDEIQLSTSEMDFMYDHENYEVEYGHIKAQATTTGVGPSNTSRAQESDEKDTEEEEEDIGGVEESSNEDDDDNNNCDEDDDYEEDND